MKYIIQYVDDATPKTKSFRSKKEALTWAEPIIKANSECFWISGLVVGEFFEGKLDGNDKAIIKRLK